MTRRFPSCCRIRCALSDRKLSTSCLLSRKLWTVLFCQLQCLNERDIVMYWRCSCSSSASLISTVVLSPRFHLLSSIRSSSLVFALHRTSVSNSLFAFSFALDYRLALNFIELQLVSLSSPSSSKPSVRLHRLSSLFRLPLYSHLVHPTSPLLSSRSPLLHSSSPCLLNPWPDVNLLNDG